MWMSTNKTSEASGGFHSIHCETHAWNATCFLLGAGQGTQCRKATCPQPLSYPGTQFIQGAGLSALWTVLSGVKCGQALKLEDRGCSGEAGRGLTWNGCGGRQQITSTWWGCSPTSSWASRRAVATSLVSVGSHRPPGKQTSPGDLLSWTRRNRAAHVFPVWEPFIPPTNAYYSRTIPILMELSSKQG